MQIARGDQTGIVHLIRTVGRSGGGGGPNVPARIPRGLCQTSNEASAGGTKENQHMNTRTIAIAALVLVVIVILLIVF